MKKLLITLFTSLVCMTATADKFGLHLASVHVPKKDYNNFNPGAYYIHSSGATVGAFRNSERRLGVYAGYTHEWGRFALTGGIITGYERHNVLPLLFPTVRIGQFRLGYIPKIEQTGAHVIHLMYEMDLK